MSVHRIRKEMKEAAEFFAHKGILTPELQRHLRQGRERAVRYRADKKTADAQVAEAAGRSRAAERLRREAAAMLTQD